MPVEILVNGYEADLTADIASGTAAPFDIDVDTLLDRWGVAIIDGGQFRALVGKAGAYELMVLSREGAAAGKLRVIERAAEGTSALNHTASDVDVKVVAIATVEGLGVYSKSGRVSAESFGWDAMTYDPFETNGDTGALTNSIYAIEMPYRGKKSLTSIGFQVRSNIASGVTAAECAIYTLMPGDTTIQRQGSNTDIATIVTSAAFKDVTLTGGPIAIPWEPGARMWALFRQDATAIAGFRCRDKAEANMQNGAMRNSPYPCATLSGGAPLASSYAITGWNRTNNWFWVGVR